MWQEMTGYINFLVISSTALGASVAFGLAGMFLKSWYLNALGLSFILNFGILAAATYHVNQSGGSQAAVAYTSAGIAFLTFAAIVSYHIFQRIKSKMQYTAWPSSTTQNLPLSSSSPGCQAGVVPTITYTVVDLQEL